LVKEPGKTHTRNTEKYRYGLATATEVTAATVSASVFAAPFEAASFVTTALKAPVIPVPVSKPAIVVDPVTPAVEGVASVEIAVAAENPRARNPIAAVVVTGRPDIAVTRARRNISRFKTLVKLDGRCIGRYSSCPKHATEKGDSNHQTTHRVSHDDPLSAPADFSARNCELCRRTSILLFPSARLLVQVKHVPGQELRLCCASLQKYISATCRDNWCCAERL
jgi:hypothetical protein